MLERARKRLDKRAKKGFRGYPVATVALYGPDDIVANIAAFGKPAMWRRKCSRSSRRLELSRS
jgi:hypothetical protein